MKIGLNTLGVILLLIGIIWMLQGANFLGGSFMTGQSQWFVIGAIFSLLGLGLLGWLNFLKR